VLLVLLPAAARQVAAYHRLDRQGFEALDQHGTARHLRHFGGRDRALRRIALVVRQMLAPCGPSLSNQNSAICVSSAPLPGMGSPKITSKALKRSLATIKMRSSPTA